MMFFGYNVKLICILVLISSFNILYMLNEIVFNRRLFLKFNLLNVFKIDDKFFINRLEF